MEKEAAFLKNCGDRKEAGLSRIRNESIYLAIKEIKGQYYYPILQLCKVGKISKAFYYKRLK